ncbi:MAG TPA: c-type cytochrome domain-containing protein [Chitinophagaceae bacterium]
MRKSTTTRVSFFALLLIATGSCKHELPEPLNGNDIGDSNLPCEPGKVYFNQQVLPILVSNCTLSGCHDDASHQEGVVLTSYDKVMATSEIRRGQPSESKLYKVIATNDPSDRMPPHPQAPLTNEQKTIIYNWIQQGAQNLSCQAACDANNFTFTTAVRPLMATKCTGCHSGTNPQGGIDISTYTALKVQVTNGKLWGSINHLAGYAAMPKNGSKLSPCELAQVKGWIDAGALNN